MSAPQRWTSSPRRASATIAPEQGTASFAALLAGDEPVIAVLPVDWSAFRRTASARETPAVPRGARGADDGAAPHGDGRRARPQAPPAERRALLETVVRDAVGRRAALAGRADRRAPPVRLPGPRLADGARAAEPPRDRARAAAVGHAGVELPDRRRRSSAYLDGSSAPAAPPSRRRPCAASRRRRSGGRRRRARHPAGDLASLSDDDAARALREVQLEPTHGDATTDAR